MLIMDWCVTVWNFSTTERRNVKSQGYDILGEGKATQNVSPTQSARLVKILSSLDKHLLQVLSNTQ